MHHNPAEILRSRTRSLNPLLLTCVFQLVGVFEPGLSPPALYAVRNEGAQLPEALDPLLRDYPAPVDRALKALKSVIEEYQGKRYARALALLPKSATAVELAVADFFILYRAKSNLALENAQAAMESFRLLQNRYPNSPLLQEAILGEVQALIKLRDAKAALAAMQNPKLELSSEVLYFRGRVQEEAGNRKEALDLYLRVYADYAAAEAATRAYQRLMILSQTALFTPANYGVLLKRAENLIRAEKYRESRSLLLKMGGVKPPEASSSQQRYLLLAESEFALKRSTTALSYLKRITNLNPSIHAHSLYLQGAIYRRLRKEALLLKTSDTALRLYSKSPFTEKLLFAVATYFELEGELNGARKTYRTLVEKFPKAENTERSLWKLAQFSYLKRNYPEALEEYWKYLRSFPEPPSVAAPIYWMGRCYEKLGDIDRATYLFNRARVLSNEAYYGRRAAQAQAALKELKVSGAQPYNGLDFRQVTELVDNIRLPSVTISEPSAPAMEVIERARQLRAADLSDLALAELRAAIRRFPKENALSFVMSRIYETQDDFYGVIITLRKAFPDYSDRPYGEFPEEVWRLFFPVRYWKTIATQAEIHRIDAALILGIIRQESAFREDAHSRQNARGLMQVLPRTGRSLARTAKVPRYTTQKLYQAETNINLGIRHLASLLQKYNQKVELALAAYNAGEDRVDRWLKVFGQVDMAEFVELIPFSETRGYVKQVLANRAHYDRLKPSPPATAP